MCEDNEWDENIYIYIADPAAIDSRADGTLILNNFVENTEGACIRVGGNTVDGRQYGKNNLVGLC